MLDIKPNDEEILLSWGRCIRNGLPRVISKPKITLNEKELQHALKENNLLISIFKDSVSSVRDYINGNYLFLLLDKEGFLLSTVGKDIIKNNIEELGLSRGMSLAEDSIGTNAVSMAIALNKPTFFTPNHNYCYIFKNWYCFAIPLEVYDHKIGFLNISTIKEPLKKELMAITKLIKERITLKYRCNKQLKKNAQTIFNDRELTILRLLANGLTEKEVASRILLSNNTVKYYKKKIFKKLSVNGTREAIVKAIKLGILILDDLEE